jgi:formate dehydrogenase maturation protein FdhE
MMDEEKEVAVKRDADALARLILDIYLEQKDKTHDIDVA